MKYKFEASDRGVNSVKFSGDIGDASAILAIQFERFYETINPVKEPEKSEVAQALLTGVLLKIQNEKIEPQIFEDLKKLYVRMCEDIELCQEKKN